MNELEAELQAQMKLARAKQKNRYDLAKQLGFTGSEATILQNWKLEKVKALAKSRGYAIPPPLQEEVKGKE